jgi:hypothetical protein
MTSSLHPYSCSKTSEIAGPAAKSVATVSVDSWYLALPPACLPRRVPARARPSRSLLKDEHALQRTCRGQTASLSGSLSRDGDRGVYSHHACPPRHLRLFYGLCTYIKSGSLPEGLFPPGPAHSPPSSYTGVSGVRNRVRISWRFRMATGSVRVSSVIERCTRVRSTGHAAQATVGRLAPDGHGRCGS